MQSWIAIIGTAAGAVIGLGSAFLTDRAKWKREQIQDRLGVRRDLYAGYIAALTEIHELMRAVSRDRQLPPGERARVIHEVFHSGGPYKLRYQIGLVADQAVLDCAEAAFQQMRDIRDLFAGPGQIEDAEYQSQRAVWGGLLRDMQLAMRAELGSGAVDLHGGS